MNKCIGRIGQGNRTNTVYSLFIVASITSVIVAVGDKIFDLIDQPSVVERVKEGLSREYTSCSDPYPTGADLEICSNPDYNVAEYKIGKYVVYADSKTRQTCSFSNDKPMANSGWAGFPYEVGNITILAQDESVNCPVELNVYGFKFDCFVPAIITDGVLNYVCGNQEVAFAD